MSRHRAVLIIAALAVPISGIGCAPQTRMERAALTAADQVGALRAELQQKVRAENDYYDRVLEDVGRAIAEARKIRIERQLQNDARAFVTSQGARPLDGQQLATYMQTSVDRFRTTMDHLDSELAKIEEELARGRQKLIIDTARLAQLRSKLQLLAQARNNGQMARFVLAFVQQTGAELSALRAEARPADLIPPEDSPQEPPDG